MSEVRPLLAARRDDAESALRVVVYKTIWLLFCSHDRLWDGPMWSRRLAAWALPYVGGWSYSPRAADLFDRIKARTCEHNWHFDVEESAGPWVGYVERCVKCHALRQVPQ